jgi:hypothetical protein
MKRFLHLLDDYIAHIIKTNNKSLLARVYGVFTFKTNFFAPIHVMIMENTAKVRSTSQVMMFDLKGSTMNRYSRLKGDQERFWAKSLNQRKVLKDVNFQEINNDIDNSLLSLSRVQAE